MYRDNSLSRKQPAKGGTNMVARTNREGTAAWKQAKSSKDKGKKPLGKVQPTLRDTGLNSPRRPLDGPVSKHRSDVKTGANPDTPLKGPVNKTYAPDASFQGSGKGRKKGSFVRQRGTTIWKHS